MLWNTKKDTHSALDEIAPLPPVVAIRVNAEESDYFSHFYQNHPFEEVVSFQLQHVLEDKKRNSIVVCPRPSNKTDLVDKSSVISDEPKDAIHEKSVGTETCEIDLKSGEGNVLCSCPVQKGILHSLSNANAHVSTSFSWIPSPATGHSPFSFSCHRAFPCDVVSAVSQIPGSARRRTSFQRNLASSDLINSPSMSHLPPLGIPSSPSQIIAAAATAPQLAMKNPLIQPVWNYAYLKKNS
ncbi:uncharacterized protein MONOS_1086p1 [Monocercomonoides exilis]|uniref:uncharacterized protein n=1 Tax=Monocercomonoides exilis TaxID=2049356 RepID=UPI00355A120B|nr:hypothetical protein MONOS_1086p1 [Monocercomonoides exilis]